MPKMEMQPRQGKTVQTPGYTIHDPGKAHAPIQRTA